MDNVEPFSEEEQKEFNKKWRKEWFERNIGSVVAMATFDHELRELFIKSFSDDVYESFRREIIEELSKYKGNRKIKWTIGRYNQYISHYAMHFQDAIEAGETARSEYAFKKLSRDKCFFPKKPITIGRAKDYLRKARKNVQLEDLSDFAKPFFKQQTRKSAKKQK